MTGTGSFTGRFRITPKRTIMLWGGAMILAAGTLALAYGFENPPVPTRIIRGGLLASIAVFLLSRLVMIWPPRMVPVRLRRWLVDVLAIPAMAAWWYFDRPSEPLILLIAAAYILLTGCLTMSFSAIWTLVDMLCLPLARLPLRRLLLAAFVLSLVGGVILALPICWAGQYPAHLDSSYPGQFRYDLCNHWLNCTFTAAAACTGTALSVYDIGNDFSDTGLVTIICLMQIGGWAVLIVGAGVCWRLRQILGWDAGDDDATPAGLVRLLRFVFVSSIVIEMAAMLLLLPMWDGEVDANYARINSPVLASVFHAVSAFCNAGLALPSDSMFAYRNRISIYAILLPLMLLGGLGGPVLHELCRRVQGRSNRDRHWFSPHTRYTLLSILALLVVGSGLLFTIESTRQMQLRNPREETPGRLHLRGESQQRQPIVFSSGDSDRAIAQRLYSMPMNERIGSSLFTVANASTGGMRVVRLDEASVSPAARLVLMAVMFVGAGFGGAAGGISLTLLILTIAVIVSPRLGGARTNCEAASQMRLFDLPADEMLCQRPDELRSDPRQPVRLAALIVVAVLVTLIAMTAGILSYREAGSFEACLFDAVSACCNVGLSTGMTPQLSITGKTTLIFAMLVGRVLPMMLLIRQFSPSYECECP